MHGKDKVACTISQLLIYNTYGGTHHAMKTNTIRHGKEHETPFLVYHGLNMHGDARQKKQIENAHELGLSVSYDRVMNVKRAIARAVCKCHADDGVITVVLPTLSLPPMMSTTWIFTVRGTIHRTNVMALL